VVKFYLYTKSKIFASGCPRRLVSRWKF